MRCLNCLTVVADTDTTCPSCRAKIAPPSQASAERPKPFFAILFMVIGGGLFNFCYPASAAVKSAGGFNAQHALYAGGVGAVCAVVGGLFDYLLSGGRR
jgi:hypothetical protein